MQLLSQGVLQFGAARAVVSFDGGVLVVQLSGLLTAAALAGITGQLCAMLRSDTHAFVADYRRAVLATTAGRLAEECRPGRRLEIPGMLVATGDAQDVLRIYALRALTSGLRRLVCPDLRAAVRWAQALHAGQGVPPQ